MYTIVAECRDKIVRARLSEEEYDQSAGLAAFFAVREMQLQMVVAVRDLEAVPDMGWSCTQD